MTLRQVWVEGNRLCMHRKDFLSSLILAVLCFPLSRYKIDTKRDNASCLNKTGVRLQGVIRNFSDNSEQIFFFFPRNLNSMGKIILHFYYPGPFNIITVKATCPRRLLPQSHLMVPVLYVQFFLSQPIPTERIMPLKQNIKSRVTFSIHNYS